MLIVLSGPLQAREADVLATAGTAGARADAIRSADPAPEPDDDLASALADAYAGNPTLAVKRYELRASDHDLGVALSETRASAQLQVAGAYEHILPGRITNASRSINDRLNDPTIDRNELSAQMIVDQPLLTGGRARANFLGSVAAIRAGREALRGAEGDLLVDVIAAYADMRRDGQSLNIRRANVEVLGTMLDEVIARREAGELTRTDIAQAQSQLQAARAQMSAAQAQLEQSRASFTALVGREPGVLAPEPPLPLIPQSIDAAFEIAERFNPDLAQAFATERASRARIMAARAESYPTLALRGIAGVSGPASPLDRGDEDVSFSARATLTVPLSSGGRVSALVEQALDRNSADRLKIEAARRQMVGGIVTAWNQMVTAQRMIEAQRAQWASAKIYYEGTVAEYREGLRSTFDVLYAHNSMRETQISLLASQREGYVAQASLLRQLGQLEAGKLLTGTGLYDPTRHMRQAARQAHLPWDGVVRGLDGLASPGEEQQYLEAPERLSATPRMAPASLLPANPDLATSNPITPIPGTTALPEESPSR